MLIKTANPRRSYLIKKLREPSTWAGLSILAAIFGVPPGTFATLAQAGMAIGAMASVLLNEQAGSM